MHYGARSFKTSTCPIVTTGLRKLGIHFEVMHWSSCAVSRLLLRDKGLARGRRSQPMRLEALSRALDSCRACRARTLSQLANLYLSLWKSFFNPIAPLMNGPAVFEISSFRLSSISIVVTKLPAK